MLDSMLDSLPTGVRFAAASALLVAGLAALIYGSDWLVRGAGQLARRLGVQPFAIGVTVVAFGTSAPELFASLGAVYDGVSELAVGNVVGSNIANICLILGFTAMLRPIPIPRGVLRLDVPVMVVISFLGAVLMMDGWRFDGGLVVRWEGVILFLGIIAYVVWQYRAAVGDTEHADVAKELEQDFRIRAQDDPKSIRLWPQFGLLVLGLAALTLGARLLVTGGVALAELVGVPEVVIGLTVVAFGTSVPELAASIRALLARETAIAVGNILGSNVFNTLCVLGLTAVVAPGPLMVPAETVVRDIPVMLLAALVCWVVMGTGRSITRTQGVLLFAGYVAWVVIALV